MKRGEIYNVDLGQTIGCEQSGKRPCVIIQNNVGNEKSPTTIVAPMTERQKKNLPTHISVSEYDEKVSRCSTIMLEQVRTVSKSRIKDFLGKLSKDTMREVDKALKISLVLKEGTVKMGDKKFYKEKIVEMMERIENLWILNQILQFILNITKED